MGTIDVPIRGNGVLARSPIAEKMTSGRKIMRVLAEAFYMRLYSSLAFTLLFCATLPAATVFRYDDRTAFDAASSGRT